MRSPLWMAAAAGILLLGSAGLSGAAAQTRQAPRARTAQMQAMERNPLARELAQLNLKPEQKTKIQGFLQQARQDIQTIRQSNSLSVAQKREGVRDITQKLRQNILGVLTKDQKAKLAQLRRQDMNREPLLAALWQLNLSDQQKTQIQNIAKDNRAKVEVIRTSNLTMAEKRTKVQALRQQMQKEILQVLTPEQREKLKQIRAQQRPGMRPGMRQQG